MYFAVLLCWSGVMKVKCKHPCSNMEVPTCRFQHAGSNMQVQSTCGPEQRGRFVPFHAPAVGIWFQSLLYPARRVRNGSDTKRVKQVMGEKRTVGPMQLSLVPSPKANCATDSSHCNFRHDV